MAFVQQLRLCALRSDAKFQIRSGQWDDEAGKRHRKTAVRLPSYHHESRFAPTNGTTTRGDVVRVDPNIDGQTDRRRVALGSNFPIFRYGSGPFGSGTFLLEVTAEPPGQSRRRRHRTAVPSQHVRDEP